ncbi:serine/threonine-protein kinase [Streptomyces poonensis]|uniref:serine/threonine-protein kinase n=1 Tax=Streptomyces poonensis TaxID=68255 RepID=UPI0016741C4B|nr:serine/threonine-protein kinase [Streptomyces poonensis]
MLIAGRYQLHDPIGRGAMGEVWRAYDETLGRPVALKLLLNQGADATAASRFRLEAQTAGRLNHPHVVGVLDFGEQEDRLYLVMELVEGDSLARLLADSGPLPAERVARIAAEAAAGLAAAHRQGIVHRDIKPANLLLDANGTLKIGDFGIARFLDDPGAALTATGQIVGTSLYIAPERALGQTAGPPSDMYSLGCVLYQLLTGRPPYQGDSAVGILHQHLDAAPVPPHELGVAIPPAFENYLLGLLNKQPQDRPTAEQAAEWFAAGSWQGRAEPLPAAAPMTAPPAAPPATPLAAPAAATAQSPVPMGETGPPTTYKLPTATGGAARVGRGHGAPRPGARGLVTRRSRVVVVVAGAVLFLAAVFVGMELFSSDRSVAENPRPSDSTTGSSSSSSPSSASASPDSAPASTPGQSSGDVAPAAPEAPSSSSAPQQTETSQGTDSAQEQQAEEEQKKQKQREADEDEPDEDEPDENEN